MNVDNSHMPTNENVAQVSGRALTTTVDRTGWSLTTTSDLAFAFAVDLGLFVLLTPVLLASISWIVEGKLPPVLIVIAYCLFVLAIFVVQGAMVRDRICQRPHDPGDACLTCRYQLTGNTTGACPECGEAIPKRQQALLASDRPRKDGLDNRVKYLTNQQSGAFVWQMASLAFMVTAPGFLGSLALVADGAPFQAAAALVVSLLVPILVGLAYSRLAESIDEEFVARCLDCHVELGDVDAARCPACQSRVEMRSTEHTHDHDAAFGA